MNLIKYSDFAKNKGIVINWLDNVSFVVTIL